MMNEYLKDYINYLIDNPRVMFSNDIEKVKTFINIPASKESLKAFLKKLEEAEWYEVCEMVKNKINEI